MYQPLMTIAISVLPHKEKNMYQRIAAIALAFCSLLPLGVAQATSADIDLLPGVTLHLGDRDQRGNYWDGYDWRDQSWWRSHQGRWIGDRSPRGYYWDGGRWRDQGWWHKNYDSRGGKYYRYKNKHYRHDNGNHYGHYKNGHDKNRDHDHHDDHGKGHGHH
ncbi:DUF2502 domain-containing protein [Hafnia paralvei]|nr:DUF2502 domain-containing protein [Hafnia paralvei]